MKKNEDSDEDKMEESGKFFFVRQNVVKVN